MTSLPKDIRKIIEFFEKLPGIGPKTAKRLGFYLLRLPQSDLHEASEHLASMKKTVHYCQVCFNLSDTKICTICSDPTREKGVITIIEDVLDLLSLEAGNHYNGVYHVLHGRIDPLNYISPDDIFLPQLIARIKEEKAGIREIILATNPDTEGEATAMYIKQKLEEIKNGSTFLITRLAYGLPIGADLEYADYMTLKKSMDGRTAF